VPGPGQPERPVSPGPQPPQFGQPFAIPPPPKKSNTGLIIGVAVAVIAVLCVCGGIVAAVATSDGEKEPNEVQKAAQATSAPATTAAPTPAATTAAPTTPPPPPPPAAPKDQTFTGRGDKVLKLKLSEDHAHIASITHSGGSNFVVTSLEASGDLMDLIVNEIGRYSGVRPLDFTGTPAALKVEAGGAWKIVVRTLDKAPMWPSAATSGKGPAVVRVNPGAVGGLTSVKITHKGSSNFVVIAYGDSRDLLVNKIGKYSGEVLLPSDAAAIEVEADGAWTMTLA
jgi:hypothetical protein